MLLVLGFGVLRGAALGTEFTVLVYNVENLFDVDGVAEFEDYRERPGGYGIGALVRKMENIRRSLAYFGEGAGPEVILFQEFELDRTPFGTPEAGAFLQRTRGIAVQDLLETEEDARNLPVELLLLKYLADHGMGGYHIAQPDTEKLEFWPAHKNVVFSRYPILYTRQRPLLDARDLLVVGLDVEGAEFVVMNNHWKSGASNPELEVVRVQNARVVRAELERILYNNPAADILIGGDLNCYYNHAVSFPELAETGVNHVLRAGLNERMLVEEGRGLYNLWGEVPKAERGSEVWRGKWGTLMQMIVTPGLYDDAGIQIVDNSFGRVILPGENVEERWGRPLAWSNWGGGAGFSDHLPIYAKFRVVEPGTETEWKNLTDEPLTAERPAVDFALPSERNLKSLAILAQMTPAQQAEHLGEPFRVNGRLSSKRPLRVEVAGMEMAVFSPWRSVREALEALPVGARVEFVGDLDYWRGTLQVVIQSPDWWQQ